MSSILNSVHVNLKSAAYKTTKYTLDWLLRLNANIHAYETKYKKDISMGIFFPRLT
jgi:hypothetical protein